MASCRSSPAPTARRWAARPISETPAGPFQQSSDTALRRSGHAGGHRLGQAADSPHGNAARSKGHGRHRCPDARHCRPAGCGQGRVRRPAGRAPAMTARSPTAWCPCCRHNRAPASLRLRARHRCVVCRRPSRQLIGRPQPTDPDPEISPTRVAAPLRSSVASAACGLGRLALGQEWLRKAPAWIMSKTPEHGPYDRGADGEPAGERPAG
jgi:hypothetical protein